MKVYLADTIQRERLYPDKFQASNLESYYAIIKQRWEMKNKINLFLDSGAYSAWSKGVEIDIQKYISFIKKYKKYIDVYAVLDSIGDAELTKKNQEIMEEAGLEPLPCFHYGEDLSYLKHYVDNYDFIALGGMVPVSNNKLAQWLDNLFSNYLTDKEGIPKVKVHGFGMTSIPLITRFPWYSVDSTSWVLTGRFGAVYMPRKTNGEYNYNEIPHKITVSDKSPGLKQEGKHYSTFSKMEQKEIKTYFDLKGFSFEELSSEYKKRDEINIIYFLDLEKNLPKYPWAFKLKRPKGLLI